MNYEHAIIMCGGSGTRLRPLTTVMNKHFLPVYDKPMIYYALANLLHIGIRKFTIVANKKDIPLFIALFKKFKVLGVSFSYLAQERAGGIPEGLSLFENLHGRRDTILALGDNLFFGNSIIDDLSNLLKSPKSGVVLQHVANPKAYGVAQVNSKNKRLERIIEKPSEFVGNQAVTGLYFYRKNVFSYLKSLSVSARGELEITDLNNFLIQDNNLEYSMLGRGVSWFDAGDTSSMLDAAALVRGAQERTGLLVSSPEEILFRTCTKAMKQNFKNNYLPPKSMYETSVVKLLEM
jgi:glucose-1-phosphate thymidylyltransferase